MGAASSRLDWSVGAAPKTVLAFKRAPLRGHKCPTRGWPKARSALGGARPKRGAPCAAWRAPIPMDGRHPTTRPRPQGGAIHNAKVPRHLSGHPLPQLIKQARLHGSTGRHVRAYPRSHVLQTRTSHDSAGKHTRTPLRSHVLQTRVLHDPASKRVHASRCSHTPRSLATARFAGLNERTCSRKDGSLPHAASRIPRQSLAGPRKPHLRNARGTRR